MGENQVTVNCVGEQDDHVDSLEDDGAEPGCDHRRPVRARVQTPKDIPSSSPTNTLPEKTFPSLLSRSQFDSCCYKNMFL